MLERTANQRPRVNGFPRIRNRRSSVAPATDMTSLEYPAHQCVWCVRIVRRYAAITIRCIQTERNAIWGARLLLPHFLCLNFSFIKLNLKFKDGTFVCFSSSRICKYSQRCVDVRRSAFPGIWLQGDARTAFSVCSAHSFERLYFVKQEHSDLRDSLRFRWQASQILSTKMK